MRCNRFRVVLAVSAVLGVVIAISGSSQAEPVIYEPFDDSDSTLNGNSTGTGLTGTWANSYDVEASDMSWGSLATSGYQVKMPNTYGRNGRAAAQLDGSLSGAGLLDDGATLWFSTLLRTNQAFGANPDFGFALGTDSVWGRNNIPMLNSGDGIGFKIKNGQLRPAYWIDGSRYEVAGPGLTTSTVYLVVGEITWGADGSSNDTIQMYLPDTDFNLGSALASHSGVLDQSTFDTLTFAAKTDGPLLMAVDEIRFGATYDDVIGAAGSDIIPEPSTFLIWALGLLGLAWCGRRRRS